MKKIGSISFAAIFLLVFAGRSKAQTKALDENGRSVLLYSNGTWRYDVDSLENLSTTDSIAENPAQFSKPADANFLLKSKVLNVGINFNSKKWTVEPHKPNEAIPEYRFYLKSTSGFAMLITETTSLELSNLQEIALYNAQKAAPDATIISSEYRHVNGLKLLCLKITGTIKGIKFEYFGYYYSNENGTVQLLTYSTQKAFSEVAPELESFLNGFTEIKD